MSVIHDPDGEFIRYIVYGQQALTKFFTQGGIKLANCLVYIYILAIAIEGVQFPCPIPTHPEKLNDIGMLRMRVCSA